MQRYKILLTESVSYICSKQDILLQTFFHKLRSNEKMLLLYYAVGNPVCTKKFPLKFADLGFPMTAIAS